MVHSRRKNESVLNETIGNQNLWHFTYTIYRERKLSMLCNILFRYSSLSHEQYIRPHHQLWKVIRRDKKEMKNRKKKKNMVTILL